MPAFYVGFFVPKEREVDEDEYERYLKAIDGMEERTAERDVHEQLRDDHGYSVPGCFRTLPAELD